MYTKMDSESSEHCEELFQGEIFLEGFIFFL